jgi:FkbM family methyltransferase
MVKNLLSKLSESVLRRRQGNPGPRQGDGDLVIHTPVPTSEFPFLFSLRNVIREQRKSYLFHPKSIPFAGATLTHSDFRGRVRRSIYRSVTKEFCDTQIGRILVIPSSLLDIAVGIAAADIAGAPMALLLISDELLEDLEKTPHLALEALTKAHFTVTANEETRAKLQLKFGEKIWQLPRFDSGANPSAGQQPADHILDTIEWIWDGLACGQPSDKVPGPLIDPDSPVAPYVDPPAPKEIHWEMRPHLLALRRLKNLGYVPDFVIDVGASTGYWSHLCQQIFPNSRFFLFEPLLSEYRQTQGTIYSLHPEFTAIEVAVSNRAETITFNMAPDLYGSSFLADSGSSKEGAWKQLQVPAKTLAALAVELGVEGHGLMKIDVQFAEHLVLEGAKGFLDQIDVIFVELSLGRLRPQAKTFAEMLNYLRGLGFEYFDVAGWWREPQTGQLIQQDAVFARRSLSKLSY